MLAKLLVGILVISFILCYSNVKTRSEEREAHGNLMKNETMEKLGGK